MGIKIARKKERTILLSALYRLLKLPLSYSIKIKFFLNMEWIFNRLAHEMSFKIYSSENHPIRINAKNFLYKFLLKNHRVLDLGCSSGELSNIIAERVNKVVGIDHNEVSIKKAKETYTKENLTFICEDVKVFLKKSSEKFDILILSHILEHIDQPKEFLLNFKESFDYIYVEVPDFDKTPANHYRKDFNMKLIYTDDDHVSEFDRDELRELFEECGVQVIQSEYIFGVQRYWCKL